MNKKVVFLDLDGTLLLRDGTMPDSAREALRQAQENGHEMVVCTGRSASQIGPVLGPDMDLFGGIVMSAGANVRRGGETVWRGAMSPEKTKELVDYFRANDITYFLQAETGIYAEPESVDRFRAAFTALGYAPEQMEEIFGDTILIAHPEDTPHLEKCCYFECKLDAEQMQEELGDYFYVVDSSYKLTRFCDGEISKAGVTKAFGMEQYLKAAGVPHEDSIAFGDGPNDLEMLQYAYIGVCMGNGTDRMKAVADRVCGRIDEDGLYHEFKALGLI